MNTKPAELFSLVGETIKSIDLNPTQTETERDALDGNLLVRITTDRGIYRIVHHQSCCENVRVHKTIGDADALEGGEITLAEEDNGEPVWSSDTSLGEDESHTWTSFFLKAGGHRLEIWILGESNGWYGETVDFEKVEP